MTEHGYAVLRQLGEPVHLNVADTFATPDGRRWIVGMYNEDASTIYALARKAPGTDGRIIRAEVISEQY